MEKFKYNTIDEAIAAIKAGQMVLVTDDEDRENEGDFIVAAEKITPEIVNFMLHNGRGVLCAPLTEDRCRELDLDMMVGNNTSLLGTPFTVTVDYLHDGCTTGVSIHDRAATIRALVDPNAKPEDFGRPGHINPLRARNKGVLRRPGHTEATIDLARMAGMRPGGALIEIMNEDGTMARLPQLLEIADRFGLKIVSIADIIAYRLRTESIVEKGEEVALIGPSGSGKSTFLRCLNLLEMPDSGTVEFEGHVLNQKGVDINQYRRRMGMVFQSFNVFPHMSCIDNITMAPVLQKLKTKEEATAQAEELLHKKGASVVLYDGNDKLEKEEILKKLESRDSVEVVLGELPEEMLDSLDLVVLSPGVPTDLPIVLKMKEKEIPVIGEVELAYQVSRGKVLAITGTNGKTTTTSLLGEIMKAYQPEVKVVGNIGTPYTSAALDTTDDTVTVAEISSFQLETIKEFHPAASAITNITEDHLNRHHTMEEYIRVKECITENQTMDDLCVLNYEDEILRPFGEKLMTEKKVQVMYFSSLRALKDGIYYQDGEIRIAKNGETELLTRTDDLKLLGLHNFENVMVASAMALHAGVPMETVRKVIQEFAGVEHRIEYVCEKDGVAYYNDSKGTNPDAAIKGIQAMNRPTLLIGGGYDKQSTYEEWIQAFDGKVRFLVLIGDTKEKIAKAARSVGFNDIIMADNLKEAVQICHDKANAGDAVLLSPACASWDQFKSYEQRGELFKEYVRAL